MTAQPGLLRQGLHLDPSALPAPRPAAWSARRRAAFDSSSMRLFREALALDGKPDIRSAVLDDLAMHYGMTPDEAAGRCLHWEEWSVAEWQAAERDSAEGLRDFYQTTQSWSFDLAWYAYLQAEGHRYPVSAVILESLRERGVTSGDHLDFGSGVGATGQLFSRAGFTSTLADISDTLLAFARFRAERRRDRLGYLDLNTEAPQVAAYDVVTAIDTLAHVPDLAATAAELHRAIRPGGWLFANFDVRPKSAENAWHLYEDDLPLRWTLHRAGFEPRCQLDSAITAYQRVEPSGVPYRLRWLRDTAVLRGPFIPAWRAAKWHVRQAAKRVLRPALPYLRRRLGR